MQINFETREEWLEWRKTKIGASDIPVIMGESPYCTSYELWKRKVGFSSDQQVNPAMQYGIDTECHVRQVASNALGVKFDPVVFQSEEMDWAIASLDGYAEDEKGKRIGVEIKCCSESDYDLAQNGKIPPKYWGQVQWQMEVADLDEHYYAAYWKDNFSLVKVERNEEYIQEAKASAEEFFECMVNYTPPPMTEKDYVLIDDPEFEEMAQNWRQAKQSLDECKRQEAYYREKLIERTDDSNCEGGGLRLTRVEREGSIDWKKLYADLSSQHPRIAKKFIPELYKKDQIGYWKITDTENAS